MNVTVENNLVSSINNYHGISLYWSRQCRIIGNTVIDVGTLNEFGLWISTAGGLGGNVIQNNIAQGLQDSTGSFVNTNNFDGWTLKQLKLYFVDPEKFDFHLKNTSDSPFIGKGNSTTAPAIDITGSFRKGAYDLGCYAFSSVALTPSNSAGNSTTEPVATQNSENVSSSEIQMPGIASIIISLLLLVGAPLL
jgi:parallel beta-helix repeat protein